MAITFKNIRGPFQNNGASPWYSLLDIGTPPQTMKINIDSGTNITWVTSTLCPPDSCHHHGNKRFDVEASSTFKFTDCLQRPFSFGPWGTMQVETGTDVITLKNGQTVPVNLFFSADYTGSQFEQLNWDGGIGLPSSSAYIEGRSTFLFQELMIAGLVDKEMPYVAFDHDTQTGTGTCVMGGYDERLTNQDGIFLPWALYNTYAGSEFLWATSLQSMTVGDIDVGAGKTLSFALDTGSSQFKGDNEVMNKTLELVKTGKYTVKLTFESGSITILPDLYNVRIEAGPDKDKVIPQFQPFGTDNLILVGSVIHGHCYTIFQYEIVECSAAVVSLSPVGVWLFNKPGGPHIINGHDRLPGRVPVKRGHVSFGARRPYRTETIE